MRIVTDECQSIHRRYPVHVNKNTDAVIFAKDSHKARSLCDQRGIQAVLNRLRSADNYQFKKNEHYRTLPLRVPRTDDKRRQIYRELPKSLNNRTVDCRKLPLLPVAVKLPPPGQPARVEPACSLGQLPGRLANQRVWRFPHQTF